MSERRDFGLYFVYTSSPLMITVVDWISSSLIKDSLLIFDGVGNIELGAPQTLKRKCVSKSSQFYNDQFLLILSILSHFLCVFDSRIETSHVYSSQFNLKSAKFVRCFPERRKIFNLVRRNHEQSCLIELYTILSPLIILFVYDCCISIPCC